MSILSNEDRIAELEAEIRLLREENRFLRTSTNSESSHQDGDFGPLTPLDPVLKLDVEHIERYSRQLLLADGFGVEGQKKLLGSSVLFVGAGGIGSTALPYLAAAGIGRIGVVDLDTVDVSNLHRQIIHRTSDVGVNKAVSANRLIQELNPTVDVKVYPCALNAENIMKIMEPFDCVVDCSDNPQTRYLVNDACVFQGKPLVSASAVGIEGQLTVYNYDKGPCYRCLYPSHAVSAGCKACTDAGVWGPVPGLMGVLQATETLKVLTRHGKVMNDRLLMYNALDCSFTKIKKPPKQPSCPVCGSNPTLRSIAESTENLLGSVGPQHQYNPALLPGELSSSCMAYNEVRLNQTPHVLLDVRVGEQYDLCHLDGAFHIPLESLMTRLDEIEERASPEEGAPLPVYCICRRGILSAEATRLLHAAKATRSRLGDIYNVTGGLETWRIEVDPSFPKY